MSQAALRALRLLEAVARGPNDGLTVMEAAEAVGADKTTASRLLTMLSDNAWLHRDKRSRRYTAGPVLVALARASGLSDSLRTIVMSLLTSLRDETGETAGLHKRIGQTRVCVAGLESWHELRRGLTPGEVVPLNRGTSSKAILAFCEPDVRAWALASARDGQERSYLEKQMVHLQEHGYVSTDSDRTLGIGAISIPVFSADDIYGSVTISGPSSRFDAERRLAFVPTLFAVAKEVSAALGSPSRMYDRWPLAGEEKHVAVSVPPGS